MKKLYSINSSGQASQTILIVVGVVVIVGIAVFALAGLFQKSSPSPGESGEKTQGPVYEIVVGDIKFKMEEAKDRGNTLKASEMKSIGWQERDITTKEKFIEVTISAENIGKENIEQGYWEISELIDSEGRRFSYAQELKAWISEESQCGALLKPGFSPTLCTTIYEVAKISTGLRAKILIRSPEAMRQGKPEEVFIDLGI